MPIIAGSADAGELAHTLDSDLALRPRCRRARHAAPQALIPDLPQGLLKKIELDLLLADLAFKRCNAALRPGQFLQRRLSSVVCSQILCWRLLFVR